MRTDKHRTLRYAESLVALGEAVRALPRFEADLAAALDFIERNAPTRKFLRDETVEVTGKCRAIEELLSDQIHPALAQFLVILTREGDLGGLRDIVRAFSLRLSELHQRASGELVSPVPLDDETVARIEQEAGRVLGKDVHLHLRVDTNVLGGLLIQVGDFVLDGTIDRQLNDIRRELLA